MKYYNISPSINGGFGSGFFSNYRLILECLIDFYESGKFNEYTPYIDWSDTAWVEGYNPFENGVLIKNENPFDFWFEQNIPDDNNDIIVKNKNRNFIIDHGKDYYNTHELIRQQEIDKKLIIKKEIIDKIDDIYEKELKNECVLGVVARGCEFQHHHPNYGLYTIYDYVTEIKKVLSKNKEITKLFLVSEDSEYIKILNDEFNNSYYLPNVFRRTDETLDYMNRVYLWGNVSTKRKEQNKLLGEETIIQTKLLGKCDYLFGMHSGVFCGAILWNENIKNIYKI